MLTLFFDMGMLGTSCLTHGSLYICDRIQENWSQRGNIFFLFLGSPLPEGNSSKF